MGTTRTVTNAIMLAVFAALCIVGMEFLAINIGQPNLLSHGYQVKALFPDADGLPTAADVRVAGVVVGKVKDISHDPRYPGYTVVTMEMSDSQADPIYRNGTAVIRPKTLLGEKYVDLTLGNGQSEAILSGDTMDPGQGTKSVSNDEIFNSFDAKTRAQQQVVLKALDQALLGRGGSIQNILPQLDTVFQNLDPLAKMYERTNPTVDQVFTNLQAVMQTLADEHTQLTDFLANGNVALGAIAQRDQALITTMREATAVQDKLNAAFQPTITAQHLSIDKAGPSLDSLHAFIDQVVGPQPACGNKKCGLDEVLNGTLNGQINYPNDQLTVTGICAKGRPGPDSCEGEYVANEYDSMFSVPSNSEKTGNPNTHSALNIVLSEQCSSLTNTATLPTILGIDPNGALGKAIIKSCKTLSGQTHTTGTAPSGATGLLIGFDGGLMG